MRSREVEVVGGSLDGLMLPLEERPRGLMRADTGERWLAEDGWRVRYVLEGAEALSRRRRRWPVVLVGLAWLAVGVIGRRVLD